jgi:heme/copper-type cytochrome/quinol oxidase subunit 3
MSSRRLGVYVLFGSLGVLFIATLVGYFVTRADSANWRAATTPAPPTGLWLSTLLALAISLSLESARRAARKNQLAALPSRLRLGIVLNAAVAREYSSSRHEGVSLCADYWHFLAVVWLVLFATLELFG